jgi:7-cyano-7-deazaguanine synthase
MSLVSDKALVLLSGGQDSATCLAYALSKHSEIYTIAFNYQQRHVCELSMAKRLSVRAGAVHKEIALPMFRELTTNALTDPKMSIETMENGLPTTFVPGRNHLFLSVSASYAYSKGISHLYTGVCESDYSGYPDCREKFIQAIQSSLSLALDTELLIHTPLMHLSKKETVLLMQDLGHLEWYRETHTCYEGVSPPCQLCPACQLRAKGFDSAGVQDPLLDAV